MKKYLSFSKLLVASLVIASVFVSCNNDDVNTHSNPHFDKDGHLKKDSTAFTFQIQPPSKVKFYVEVSGSMNGFFRANKATDFKTDVWAVIASYPDSSTGVIVLTNDGGQGASYPMDDFKVKMNAGSFESPASTKVPAMLKTIINSLDADNGEVAVLVSDMKYSPVGSEASDVLMTQYSTDVKKTLKEFGKAVSLICATSNYLDKSGKDVTARSPYYFLILGKPECVASMRNGISIILKNSDHFVDNIETGFDFGQPKHSFEDSNSKGCSRLAGEPTFTGYKEVDDGDTCVIWLKVNVENYRWIMADTECFRSAFKAKAKYGSKIKVGEIKVEINDDTKNNERKAVAAVELKVFNMRTDSDVIEWTIELPDTNDTLFKEFFNNAISEDDQKKSFTLKDFVKGMLEGLNNKIDTNYILISKNG